MTARLSLTMIVKNEAATLGHCLPSVRVIESWSGMSHTLDAQLTFGYDAAGRLTSLERSASWGSHNMNTSYSYDNASRLTNRTTADTTTSLTLANYTYGYDAASQLTSYQDNNNSSLTYSYDSNGELTGASGTLNGSNYSVGYSYDANGNRNMTGYTTGKGNELTSDGTYNYTYDNDGNMTSQTNIATGYVTDYSWDYRNRLTEVKQEDNHGNVLNDETFTYDVNNNRIAVSLNGTPQLYTVYDGANPYMDFNGNGQLTERYLYNPNGMNQFYGQVSGSGTTQWFLTDNINSIRQVVSTSGSVLDAITYDPFGNIVTQTNASNAPRFLYAGGAIDPLTGGYDFGRREENPALGRWTSQDPLGLLSDSDPYRYVYNDPASLTDENGEDVRVSHGKHGEIWIARRTIGFFGGLGAFGPWRLVTFTYDARASGPFGDWWNSAKGREVWHDKFELDERNEELWELLRKLLEFLEDEQQKQILKEIEERDRMPPWWGIIPPAIQPPPMPTQSPAI